jgi:aspartate aminotransferase
MKISLRAQNIEQSPTLALDAIVSQLEANGHPVINLTSGQLDTPTPSNVKLAGIKAIENNFTRYTPTPGILSLRELLAEKFTKMNSISTKASQVVVGVGAKQLLYNAFQVVCDPGDEVLLSIPTWTTYIEQIKLAQAVPNLVQLEPPFELTAEKVEKALTKKTKVIVINSPSNPTGAVISKKELMKIGQLAVKHDLVIITDEIYESIVFDKPHYSIASFSEDIAKQTITINGLSKAYSMTGWRVGYATGPDNVIAKMSALQSQTTSNTASISQYASVEALAGSQESVEHARVELNNRRDYLAKEFAKINGFSFHPPEGAFYFFVSIEKLLTKKLSTSEVWCQALLEQEGVALVPGEAFLAPGYFRLSFAASMSMLQEAVKRIKRFVSIHD